MPDWLGLLMVVIRDGDGMGSRGPELGLSCNYGATWTEL